MTSALPARPSPPPGPCRAPPPGAQPGRVTGRRLVSTTALTLQAALLLRHAPAAVADAFSRLGGDWAPTFGILPAKVDTAAVLDFGRHG